MRHGITVTALILISQLSACATKDSIIPREGKPMQEIYRDHMRAMNRDAMADVRANVTRPMSEQRAANDPSSSSASPEFVLLPNPTLNLYVYPHFAQKDRLPIPGYQTQFKMYERDEYALPGELTDVVDDARKK